MPKEGARLRANGWPRRDGVCAVSETRVQHGGRRLGSAPDCACDVLGVRAKRLGQDSALRARVQGEILYQNARSGVSVRRRSPAGSRSASVESLIRSPTATT